MADIWNAETYTTFLSLRTKPAQDLLFAIPTSFMPEYVIDLGCGTGNSTIILKERWPKAKVTGLDSSLAMLKVAKETYPQLEFMEGDMTHFTPLEKVDCIFSNAALHWASDHGTIIPRLLSLLNPKGILAIQIPNNFHLPSHQVTIQLLEDEQKWRPLLETLRYGYLTQPYYHADTYYDLFTKANVSQTQLWETVYVQEMANHQAIFNWVQGTGLRPILSKMDKADQAAFEKAYVAAISEAYPKQSNGKVLLPFQRLFMVAML